jgi:hypothetical protein
MKYEHKTLAGSGWYRVDSTDTVSNIPHYGLMCREDTVIESWTATDAEGGTRDLVAYFGVSSKTVGTSDAAMIIPDAWTTNTPSIKLTSGSVNLLRK